MLFIQTKMKFREEKCYFKNYDNPEDEVWRWTINFNIFLSENVCQLWQYI